MPISFLQFTRLHITLHGTNLAYCILLHAPAHFISTCNTHANARGTGLELHISL